MSNLDEYPKVGDTVVLDLTGADESVRGYEFHNQEVEIVSVTTDISHAFPIFTFKNNVLGVCALYLDTRHIRPCQPSKPKADEVLEELKDRQKLKLKAQKAAFAEYSRINEELIALNDEILNHIECNY